MIFMFDAGMKSLPASFEYNVSSVRGSTISTPQCACRLWQLALDALEDEASQVLSRRHQLSVTELGDIEIDVAVIESISDLLLENSIEHSEVDHESRLVVDRSADGDVAHVGVPMEI